MMLTMHENPDYLLEALKAGAAGYVLKDAPQEEIIEAVRTGAQRGVPAGPGVGRPASTSVGQRGGDAQRNAQSSCGRLRGGVPDPA